jgi:predicted nucleic acid-binding protein
VVESIVFDTSACFAFLENEPGADIVEKYLLEAKSGSLIIHASFVTLTEIEYIITQERSSADAAEALGKIAAWLSLGTTRPKLFAARLRS